MARYDGSDRCLARLQLVVAGTALQALLDHMGLASVPELLDMRFKPRLTGKMLLLTPNKDGLRFAIESSAKQQLTFSVPMQWEARIQQLPVFGRSPTLMELRLGRAIHVLVPEDKDRKSVIARTTSSQDIAPVTAQAPIATTAAAATVEVTIAGEVCDIPFAEALRLVAKYARR
jgi:hypothetical protein